MFRGHLHSHLYHLGPVAHKPQSTSCSLVPSIEKAGTISSHRKLLCRGAYGVSRNSLKKIPKNNRTNSLLHPLHRHQGLRSFLVRTFKNRKFLKKLDSSSHCCIIRRNRTHLSVRVQQENHFATFISLKKRCMNANRIR